MSFETFVEKNRENSSRQTLYCKNILLFRIIDFKCTFCLCIKDKMRLFAEDKKFIQ